MKRRVREGTWEAYERPTRSFLLLDAKAIPICPKLYAQITKGKRNNLVQLYEILTK